MKNCSAGDFAEFNGADVGSGSLEGGRGVGQNTNIDVTSDLLKGELGRHDAVKVRNEVGVHVGNLL